MMNHDYTERMRLCQGMFAYMDGKTLCILKDGRRFHKFQIGATTDWMSGQFSINGQLMLSWDRGRRRKRNKYDCWEHCAKMIVEAINRAPGNIYYETNDYVCHQSARGMRITAKRPSYPRSRVVDDKTWETLIREHTSDAAFNGAVCFELGIGTYGKKK